MNFSWDDLRLFLEVARLGGLSAAAQVTGLSAATLGRRITALERQMGERLFVRSQTGYQLTEAGTNLLERAEEVATAMRGLMRWKDSVAGLPVVRISAGPWTSAFIASRIDSVWTVADRFVVEFVTATEKVDIGRRHADIGIRNQRPTEQWLAGRQVGSVAYGIYAGRNLINGVKAGYFVGTAGKSMHSERWLEAHHGDRIALRGNDAMAVRELVAAGAGLSVFPCFVGDSDPRLVRVAPPIAELATDQWLVSHHEGRHEPAVKAVAERLATLLKSHAPLFGGALPLALP
ncbi:LysR family transcriptional regulator [Devosia aquimaris]|uniref:LysR family transcriptional regulator n=1 Tax=Devosia aquimaris TaxID=2866214 RepID=UPI001CD11315|nr:LysR family transcriptional regulator [Devosia sp. CJK-A8-3]